MRNKITCTHSLSNVLHSVVKAHQILVDALNDYILFEPDDCRRHIQAYVMLYNRIDYQYRNDDDTIKTITLETVGSDGNIINIKYTYTEKNYSALITRSYDMNEEHISKKLIDDFIEIIQHGDVHARKYIQYTI